MQTLAALPNFLHLNIFFFSDLQLILSPNNYTCIGFSAPGDWWWCSQQYLTESLRQKARDSRPHKFGDQFLVVKLWLNTTIKMANSAISVNHHLLKVKKKKRNSAKITWETHGMFLLSANTHETKLLSHLIQLVKFASM